MSTSSVLKARLARLGPVRDAAPPPSFSGAPVPLFLVRTAALDRPIDVVSRLREAGLTLRAAHAVLDRLVENGSAVCRVAEDAGIAELAADLAALNVEVRRKRPLDARMIADVRARHGLSQREFAEVLGLDIDRLQNWEQGRNKPDNAVLNLVLIFDQAPDLVQRMTCAPVICPTP
jgi:DNA-binding transcriptional regulator YiaG